MNRRPLDAVYLLLLVASLWWPLANAEQSPLLAAIEAADVPLVRLDDHLLILRDTSAALTIADVASGAQRDDFRPARPADLAPGYTNDAIWVRVTLRNSSSSLVERYLEVGPPRLHDIRVYEAVDGGFRERRAGLRCR